MAPDPMPVAKPASGDYTGPAADWNTQWNTGTYVGVPDAYRAQQGYANDPALAAHFGVPKAYVGVYGVPQYRYSDIDALWGKPKGQVFDLQYKLYSLGYLPSFVPGTMTDKVAKAAEQAFSDANKNGITLEQMLNQRDPSTGRPLGGGAGGGSGGVTSSTSVSSSHQTQRSVTLTSREGAMAVLANALAQELGRQPSQAELTRFTNSLNAAQRANPDVTTSDSTTTTRASQSTSGSHVSSRSSSSTTGSTVTKQGNVDPAYEATQFAKSAPLAAERSRFQDSQYFDVIASMIGAK